MQKFEFEYANKHLLARIEEKLFLIDTGSPISFVFDENKKNLMINGLLFCLNNNILGVNEQEVNKFTGRSIDGFLGLDMISSLGSLYINKDESYLMFGNANGIKLPHQTDIDLKSFNGLPVLDVPVCVNGKECRSILDTGACISYFSSDLIEGKALGTVSDYSPSLGGEIIAEKYELELGFCGESKTVEAAKMNEMLETSFESIGYKAIIGFGEIGWTELLLDIENCKLGYK